MIKVAMIGAGSVVFSKNLTGDILGYPEFRDATMSYMDIDAERLEVGASLCRKAASAVGARPRIEATQDRREALRSADFVINMVQIGGFDSTLVDFEIPRKYGLNFTIADTTGPGGLFRALRTFPMLSALCRDMADVCPNAILLNYSNPMSMNMQTVAHAGCVRAIGLCHSVQGTFCELMHYLGEDPAHVSFICAGINHMAFYLKLEKDGQDLYPRLFGAMARPEVYCSNKVRFELMKRLGYFVTESSEHNAEYSPWFIPHGPGATGKFSVPIDEYLRRCDNIIDEFERLKGCSRSDAPIEVRRSREYGSTIIHSMATGTPSLVYGNMPNRGTITNLPDSAIAEAPTRVDSAGPRFEPVGELPPQLIGYMQPHVIQHELFIRAATEGRRDHLYQAAMFDPLTSATLGLDQIVELCDELIAAHGGHLPALQGKRSLVPASGREFAATDPSQLRDGWRRRRAACEADCIVDWHVIGPFPCTRGRRDGLELRTVVEDEFLQRPDGSVNLQTGHEIDGNVIPWRKVRAGRRGFVDLCESIGRREWVVGYAYAELQSTHGREAMLRCGSDDGIKLWLNGQLVHHHEVGRGYIPGSDEVPVQLIAGTNRVFVKVDNYTAGWGFGVGISTAVG